MPKKWERWPAGIKQEALALAAQHGAVEASKRTTVPACTIRSWMHRTVKDIEAASNGMAVIPTRTAVGFQATWRERAPVIVASLGELITLAIEQTRVAMTEGRLREAQAGVISIAVLIDKSSLLSGGPTTRSESFSVTATADDVATRIRELELELGYTPRGELGP